MRVVKLAILLVLVMASSAFAALAAHYRGNSRDHSEFRFYLHGGDYLGRAGKFQSIGVAVHQLRKGQPIRNLRGCIYRFDDSDRSRDRIECGESTPVPLTGAEYARDPKTSVKGVDFLEEMVCVRRCNANIPLRLSLEDADEDNS